MLRYWGKLLVAGACVTAIAACARQEPPQPARPADRPVPAPAPAARAPSPADYFTRAASIDLFLVRSSELALSRSQDPRLREFARRMVEAHHGTAAQLSLAGRRLNLLPSTVLQAQEQRALDELQRSPQFDRLYWRELVTIHSVALDLHSNYARSGTSPTLKPVAAAAAPIYRRHLDQLRSIR